MVKWLLLFLTIVSSKADTNIVWQFPYIRPFLLMRGTNSFQYDTCWQFESWNGVTNPVGTLVITPVYTNLDYPNSFVNYDTNFTFTTSNHVANRTYFYNTAYRQVDLSGVTTNVWKTNQSEIIITQTNAPPPTNVLAAPRLLYIFEEW